MEENKPTTEEEQVQGILCWSVKRLIAFVLGVFAAWIALEGTPIVWRKSCDYLSERYNAIKYQIRHETDSDILRETAEVTQAYNEWKNYVTQVWEPDHERKRADYEENFKQTVAKSEYYSNEGRDIVVSLVKEVRALEERRSLWEIRQMMNNNSYVVVGTCDSCNTPFTIKEGQTVLKGNGINFYCLKCWEKMKE